MLSTALLVTLVTLVTLLTFDLLYCFPLTSPFHTQKDIGTIWQVTDFHLDVNYSTHGDRSQMCHNHPRTHRDLNDVLSTYGDYSCDSPWALVSSAISAMKSIEAAPDFILWTGDSIPHIEDSEDSEDKVYEVIGNITQFLRATFPNTTIYPTVGNHDAYPSNQMPDTPPGSDFYGRLLNRSHWADLLQPNDQAQFITAGYYSTLISEGFRLISLNTNLYYSFNKLTPNTSDPGGQLQWLRDQLDLASHNNETVLLMAHVPPGIFERCPFIQWMQPRFNEQLVDILSNYSDTVPLQIYGHEHTDTFRMLYKDGVAASVMLMAPAVAPMNSTLPGVGPNNPGIRLYYYNRTSHRLLNYHQYYLNLSLIRPGVNHAVWQLEYRALEDLRLHNFSAPAFLQLASTFSLEPELDRRGDRGSGVVGGAAGTTSSSPSPPFRRYLRYNSASFDRDPVANRRILAQQVCSIEQPTMHGYAHCVSLLSHGELDIVSDTVAAAAAAAASAAAGGGGGGSFFPRRSTPPPQSFLHHHPPPPPDYTIPMAVAPHREAAGGSVHIYVYYIVAVCTMCLCLTFVILAVLRKRYTTSTTTPFLPFRYHPLTEIS